MKPEPLSTNTINRLNNMREGNRNSTVFQSANEMKRAGYEKEEIMEVLQEMGQRAGLDSKEISETVESASKYGNKPLTVRYFDDVEIEEKEWIVRYRIPRRQLSLVAGKQGDGKSYMLLDLASKLSHGLNMPDGSESPKRKTLYCFVEDSPSDVRLRLENANADLKNNMVGYIHLATEYRNRNNFNIATSEGIKQLRDAVIEGGFEWVIIDPFNNFIGGNSRTDNDSATRHILGELDAVAQECNVGITYLMHFSKDRDRKGIDKILNSTGHSAFCRVVLFVKKHPEEYQRRLLTVEKTNSTGELPAWEYKLLAVSDNPDAGARVEWTDVNSTATFEDWDSIDTKDAPVRDECEEVIMDCLSDEDKGTVETTVKHGVQRTYKWDNVLREVKEQTGASNHTINNARTKLLTSKSIMKCKISRTDGKQGGGKTVWFIPREIVAPAYPEDDYVITL